MPATAVQVRVNDNQMSAALRQLSIVSDRLPAQLVNQAAYRVNQKAVWAMPVTSREKISAELGESKAMELVRLKSGRFSRNKKHLKSFFNDPSAGELNLLVKIIQDRANFGHPSPWKGVDRATGARLMLEKMRKVFGARIKSRGYFKAAVATIRDIFKRAAGNKIPFSDSDSRGSGTTESLKRDAGRIAKAYPATAGRRAFARFEIISPRHDTEGAIFRVVEPIVQTAMDDETKFLLQKSFELELRSACRALSIKTN